MTILEGMLGIVTTVAGIGSEVIKDRALFSNKGISDKERSLGKTLTVVGYTTSLISGVIYTVDEFKNLSSEEEPTSSSDEEKDEDEKEVEENGDE